MNKTAVHERIPYDAETVFSSSMFLDYKIVYPQENQLTSSQACELVAESRQNERGSRTAACRGELKYLITEDEYQKLRSSFRPYLEPDAFAHSQISSLYLDTPDNTLVRRSLDKPAYKEKLRIRSYGLSQGLNSHCFLEIKKKYKGTVYKRRVEMTLAEAAAFCQKGTYPKDSFSRLSYSECQLAEQVLAEIEWLFMQHEYLCPSFLVSCRRLSLKERDSDSLRITFDRAIQWSHRGLWQGLGNAGCLPMPESGGHPENYVPAEDSKCIEENRHQQKDTHAQDYCEFLEAFSLSQNSGSMMQDLLDEGYRIMEIKSTKGFPSWLIQTLNEQKIYPRSFSKVGNSYRAWLRKTEG